MRRAVIYARVSTVDRGQDPETQLRQLHEYADRRVSRGSSSPVKHDAKPSIMPLVPHCAER
jgi:predicted site-specific integrase-resolvase